MSDVFDGVIGQADVVSQLRAAVAAPVHAYLLVGPAGAGSAALARAFSAALLCADGGDGTCRDCRLALTGEHPDATTFEPTGAFLRLPEAEEIVRLASLTPVEGRRKVLVLTEFHRVREVGPALLKTIEEPPESTVFVVLADAVPPELTTIASRCVRIDVRPLPTDVVASVLIDEGVDEDRAAVVAAAAAGNIERARLLVTDPGLATRQKAWEGVPERLDGSGAAVAVIVVELLELLESSAGSIKAAQADPGRRRLAKAEQDKADRRELRRHRTEELRAGLATVAVRYRDALVGADDAHARAIVAGLDALSAAGEAITRNPNEALLLQALLLRLPPLLPSSAPPG